MTEERLAAAPKERFVHHCALRWSDLDAYGHVNNARFLTLLEEARAALMFLGDTAAESRPFADGVVIARHEIDYLRPVGYVAVRAGRTPTVRIEMWVEEIRHSRFTLCYELFDGDVLACRARSVLVPFDLKRGRARRLTEAERNCLEPYAIPPDPLGEAPPASAELE